MDHEQLSKIPTDHNREPILAMVRNATKREKAILMEHKHLVPSSEISILSLLRTPLPTIFSAASVLLPAESRVVCDPPSWSEAQLKVVRVPQKEWLAALDDAIVEGWLKGVCSIKHPSDEKMRFPLWAGTFWMALSDVILEHRAWVCAQEWVFTLPQGPETRKLEAVLCWVSWKGNIWMLPVEAERVITKPSFFAKLLSDDFLAECHIDAFVMRLNVEARRMTPNAPRVLFAYLQFTNTLSSHFDATTPKIKTCTIFLQYAAMFRKKKNTMFSCSLPMWVARKTGTGSSSESILISLSTAMVGKACELMDNSTAHRFP
jgi:hypothetical protein